MPTRKATPATPHAGLAVKELDVKLIDPSPLNTRTKFDLKEIADLAKSIEETGLLQPILVRPHPKKSGRLELVYGERRLRAHKHLKRDTIPGRIAKMDDADVLVAQTVENLQRVDITPLEEGRGYRRLQEKLGYSPRQIAGKIGKSESYVLRRMKLTDLIESAQTQLEKGKLSVAQAILLSRLQPKEQQRALGMIRNEYNGEIPIETLNAWIQREIYHNLESAPFDAQAVGESDDDFEAKVQAFIRQKKAEAKEAGLSLVEVVTGYPRDTKPLGLTPAEWRDAKGRECENTVPGIIVQGADRGRVLQVCTNRRCRTHWGLSDPRARAEAERERRTAKKARARRRKAEAVRYSLLQAVSRKAPARLNEDDLTLIALAFIDNMPADLRKRLATLHGWLKEDDADTTKVHDRIIRRVKSMERAEVGRLLRELALLDELRVPSDQVGRAPTRLLQTAERFGLDVDEIRNTTLAELREQLTPKKKTA